MVEQTDTGKRPDNESLNPDELMAKIWQCLSNVSDPEVPVLTVLDLGVVRKIVLKLDGAEFVSEIDDLSTSITSSPPKTPPEKISVLIQITPTYTGCPAMSMIATNIKLELIANGIKDVQVEEILSPAWTTDWMTESGKQKLKEYGIAPPQAKARVEKMLFDVSNVPCPQCNSKNTEMISEFGSTACKSLYRCLDCREPFDYFKCH